MGLPVNRAYFFRNVGWATTGEKTSGPALFPGVSGVIFYCRSSVQGVLHIDVQFDDENWDEVVEVGIVADKLHVTDVKYLLPKARVRFTPDTEVDARFTCVAYGYPAVYVSPDFTQFGTERDQV
jgi:hypothetical protein